MRGIDGDDWHTNSQPISDLPTPTGARVEDERKQLEKREGGRKGRRTMAPFTSRASMRFGNLPPPGVELQPSFFVKTTSNGKRSGHGGGVVKFKSSSGIGVEGSLEFSSPELESLPNCMPDMNGGPRMPRPHFPQTHEDLVQSVDAGSPDRE
ncbi:hypothetical protein [Rhizobium sp. FKY42]|uniref:hypothetical protein n=1 Tax=Rhizobium sp. FKY42 TaxID=2562310 RepID=UPI0010BFF77A|nr:hypothetical protein [Rhizobium sp. FKY42]